MRKFTFSRTIKTPDGQETFTAVEFDAFDEAKKAVDKGIYDRMLELNGESANKPETETDMAQDVKTNRPHPDPLHDSTSGV